MSRSAAHLRRIFGADHDGVTAYNRGEESNLTVAQQNAAAAARGVSTPLGTMAAPTAGVATANSQALTWVAPAGGPTRYILQFRRTAEPVWKTFSDSLTSTSATVTGLTASTSYTYRIRAANRRGVAAAWSPTTAASTTS
jgi:hypothetical protein